MAAYREEALHGLWVHSHEEDTAQEMIFRPESYPLPLARGRTTLELSADGTYTEGAPGPVDLPEETKGSWSLDGDRLVLRAEGNQPDRSWTVVEATPDRLAVRAATD